MGPGIRPTILVVDDESYVRRVLKHFLERSGYQVLDTGCGEEALRVLAHRSPDIALLLTDIIMPGLSGIQLATQALKVKPTLPVLFMSGYCGEFEESLNGHQYLQKPFNPKELLSHVAQILDTQPKPQ